MSVEQRAKKVGLHGKGVSIKITYSDMKSVTRSNAAIISYGNTASSRGIHAKAEIAAPVSSEKIGAACICYFVCCCNSSASEFKSSTSSLMWVTMR